MSVYTMAGLNIRIEHQHKYTANLCREYLSPEGTVPDFTVRPNPADYEADRQIVRTPTESYLECLSVYRAIANNILDYNGFVMHASVVEKDGHAFAFAAKSGTGKSTHSRLWLERFPTARIINGDKPLIRLFDKIPYVYGTPWCGKENYQVNTRAPLDAICFLERAETNSIEQISKSDAVSRIFTQLLLPKESERLILLLDHVGAMLEHTVTFVLHCNMDIEAADVACSAMEKAIRERDGLK